MSKDELWPLLAECTVRVEMRDANTNIVTESGTGFFAAPGIVITNRHVIETSVPNATGNAIGTCYWRRHKDKSGPAIPELQPEEEKADFIAEAVKAGESTSLADLAILRLNEPYPEHKCVCITKGITLKDEFLSFGFPGGGAHGDSLMFEFEAFTSKDSWTAIKLKKGKATSGFSGSAVLNLRTRAVCAVLYSGDDTGNDTARAVPIELALEQWPQIANAAGAYEQLNPAWYKLLPLTQLQEHLINQRERLNRVPVQLHPTKIIPPLQADWGSFISAKQWPEYIEQVLKKISSEADLLSNPQELRNKLNSIDPLRPYDAILSQLRGLRIDRLIDEIQEYRKRLQRQFAELSQGKRRDEAEKVRSLLNRTRHLKKYLFIIANELNVPSFQRCFLVMGSFGAGKTHFLATLLEESNTKSLVIPIPFETAQSNSIEKTVLTYLSDIMNMEWNSLADITAFIAGATGRRIVIAIDDLHDFLKREARLSRSLLDAVRSVQCPELYWLVFIDEANYYLLQSGESPQQRAEENQFWLEYGFTRTRPLPDDLDTSTEDASEPDVAASGGWLSLDSLNAAAGTGWRLLKVLLGSGEVSAGTNEWGLAEPVHSSLLNNPWIAWTAWEIRDRLKNKLIFDVNYVEFAREFWSRYKVRVAGDVHPTHVYGAIQLIIKTIIDSMDAELQMTQLESRITTSGGLLDRQTLRKAIDCLAQADLVRLKTGGTDEFEPAEEIDLRFAFFWAWRIAEGMVKEIGKQQSNPVVENKDIISRFLASDHGGLDRDTLTTFVLLLLDLHAPENKRIETTASDLWGWVARTSDLQSTFWFTVPRAGIPRQTFSIRGLERHRPNINSSSPRDIFALVHMMREVHPAAIDYGKRFHFLRPFYQIIADAGLTDYFLLTVRECFASANSEQEIKSALIAFGGCELLQRSEPLAKAAYEALLRLLGHPENIIPVMIEYLKDVSKDSSVPERKERYFYQFMLAEFCRQLVENNGPEAFWDLREANWYEAAKLGIRYPIDKEMKKEANFSMGFWYRTHRYGPSREQYVNLVSELAATGKGDERPKKQGDREAAFFLIRHTSPTWKERTVRVDSAFLKVVTELRNDATIAQLNRKYSFIVLGE